MANRMFSFVMGVIYLGIGICGFIPACRSLPTNRLEYQAPMISINYGYVFGNIPMNIVSDLMFVSFGLLGIACAVTMFTSRAYAFLMFFTGFGLLCAGLTPLGANSMFGFMPIYEWDVPIFLLTSVFSFYFAFIEGPKGHFWAQPILPQ